MNTAKNALQWIATLLKSHHIPFQLTGGLVAIAYGATHPLQDIDIDILDLALEVDLIDIAQIS